MLLTRSTALSLAPVALLAAGAAGTAGCGATAGRGGILAIPYQRTTLENGLNVIFHHDPRLPRVAVNVLYRVGSRDDPPGRTGMAHLFEHLMFMGTARVPNQRMDALMEQAGGWNNAYTTHDLTVYYDVGPDNLLPTLLWIEADRMATLAEALTGPKLEVQRDVVQNELRQSYLNVPYGPSQLVMPAMVFPAGHPYAAPIIGSAADIEAITLDDVRRVHRTHYAPQNASLVVAGRFNPDRTPALVERYFGWIPRAPHPVRPPAAVPPDRPAERRRTLHDEVELPRVTMMWPSPALLAPGDAEMDLCAEMLAEGKHSRLHRALVHEQKIALEVDAYQESRELGSQFVVEVTARDGVDATTVERAAEEVLRVFRGQGPDAREVRRAVVGYEAHFVSRMQKLERRAELLNLYWARAGEPDFVEADLDRYRRATTASVHAAAVRVLAPERRATLVVLPATRGARSGETPPGGADRVAAPAAPPGRAAAPRDDR